MFVSNCWLDWVFLLSYDGGSQCYRTVTKYRVVYRIDIVIGHSTVGGHFSLLWVFILHFHLLIHTVLFGPHDSHHSGGPQFSPFVQFQCPQLKSSAAYVTKEVRTTASFPLEHIQHGDRTRTGTLIHMDMSNVGAEEGIQWGGWMRTWIEWPSFWMAQWGADDRPRRIGDKHGHLACLEHSPAPLMKHTDNNTPEHGRKAKRGTYSTVERPPLPHSCASQVCMAV